MSVPPGNRIWSCRLLIRVSATRSEEHTSELQSLAYLVCRLLLEKKKMFLFSSEVIEQRELSCYRSARNHHSPQIVTPASAFGVYKVENDLEREVSSVCRSVLFEP